MGDTVRIDIVEWNKKIHAVYINDFRVTGRETKPWGGGKTVKSFTVKVSDLLDAIEPWRGTGPGF